jgi:hypothetical protein
MDQLERMPRDHALREIADAPASLEFRAVALDPQGAVYRSDGGLIVVAAGAHLVGAMGEVRPRDVAAVCGAQAVGWELLADGAAHRRLGEAFRFERALVWTLGRPWAGAARRVDDLTIRPLEASDSLDHLSDELREEIGRQWPPEPVIAGFVGPVAVGFSYCASQTETWADISIDTLEGHRGRGVGAAVASVLIDDIVARGKQPVWGAVESNAASLRLAEKLGFTRAAGELFVCERE